MLDQTCETLLQHVQHIGNCDKDFNANKRGLLVQHDSYKTQPLSEQARIPDKMAAVHKEESKLQQHQRIELNKSLPQQCNTNLSKQSSHSDDNIQGKLPDRLAACIMSIVWLAMLQYLHITSLSLDKRSWS